jgi:hypothetical protein
MSGEDSAADADASVSVEGRNVKIEEAARLVPHH